MQGEKGLYILAHVQASNKQDNRGEGVECSHSKDHQ
jgi:hypothetical protein